MSDIQSELPESIDTLGETKPSKFLIPPEWGTVLSLALPQYQPVIVNLTGAAVSCSKPSSPSAEMIVADLTAFYPLLKAMNFEADLFVLSPPWDLYWNVPGKDHMDSTVAALVMALDLCSVYGEGFLISKEAALQRLIFNGHHNPLACHVWAHLVVEGNICQTGNIQDSTFNAQRPTFQTGVIWFARSHDEGVQASGHVADLAGARTFCEMLAGERMFFRHGAESMRYAHYQWLGEVHLASTRVLPPK